MACDFDTKVVKFTTFVHGSHFTLLRPPNLARLPARVVDEVADICRCNGWKYILLDSTPPGLPRRAGVL